MKIRVQQALVAFIVGFIFSVGLGIAGMTKPQNVIGFLNPLFWNPSLIFVMVGAIAVHAISYPLIRKKNSPLFDVKFHVPERKDITARLVIGAIIFGIGWGLGGFCPGPALTSIASGDMRVFVFVAAMLVGMTLFISLEKYLPFKK